MTEEEALDRLAETVGIDPSYVDVWGNRRDIPRDTKRGLLAAMGLALDGPGAAAEALRTIEQRAWRRMLSPARVMDEGAPLEITFTLPEDAPGTRLAWTLAEESGETRTGDVALGDLPVRDAATVDGVRYERRALALPHRLPAGYHRLRLEARGRSGALHEGAVTLIVTPPRCVTPDDMVPGGRLWGMGVQLYGLTRAGDWGIGDFTSLARFGETMAGLGADTLGLNPLHALFPADPNHFSPYSPSSRSFLNVLYIDIEAVPDLAESAEARDLLAAPEMRRDLAAARGSTLVDYANVTACKLRALAALHDSFRKLHLEAASPTARGQAFHAFRNRMGPALRRLAVFDALHAHFFSADPGKWAWQHWPASYRHPDSPEVAAFAQANARRVEFFEYLQWLADQQLGAAADSLRAAGMRVGIYCDLAIANHPGSGSAWANPGVILSGVSVGAPPDLFSPLGQNWGLAPLSPLGLRETAYEAFISGLRANMRHAGAVRIDHAMGLQRLYWIPEGAGAADGAYVRYPLRDLARIVALESVRNRAIVVGEDLGTVPDGFREVMRDTGILSYRVLYFERDASEEFQPPEAWPRDALVSVTTHDLPTLKGYWRGHDIALRQRLGLFPDAATASREEETRRADRARLLRALARAGLLPGHLSPDAPPDELPVELVAAVHCYLAKTTGRILMVQLEDAIGEIEQPNLPGTIDQHPNWRRRSPLAIEALRDSAPLRELAARITAARQG